MAKPHVPSGFVEALKAAYLEAPCAVLPNALWKTLARLDEMDAHYSTVAERVESIALSAPGEMHSYWHRDWVAPVIAPEVAKSLRFALLHQAYVDAIALPQLTKRRAYFRLSHDLSRLPPGELPAGYRLRQVELPNEAEAAASLIAACYPDIRPAPEAVRNWAGHPTHAADLWLWVLAPDGSPAGLGIAELDGSVPEGSLEWIQVLHTNRGLGLGTALVCELLRRLAGRALFATVSGQVNNLTRPERLYRRCEFTGGDVWVLMQSE